MSKLRILLLPGALILLAAVMAAHAQQATPSSGTSLRWYKGNTHTHTLNSDGDSTPDEVVRWYREHGYQFLVLTDHNFLTAVDGLNAVHGADEKFLVIRGEEVTDASATKPCTSTASTSTTLVDAARAASVVDVAAAERRRHPQGRTACRTSTIRTSAGR